MKKEIKQLIKMSVIYDERDTHTVTEREREREIERMRERHK